MRPSLTFYPKRTDFCKSALAFILLKNQLGNISPAMFPV